MLVLEVFNIPSKKRGDELWEEFVSYISSICSVCFIFVPMFFYLQDDETPPLDLGDLPLRVTPAVCSPQSFPIMPCITHI